MTRIPLNKIDRESDLGQPLERLKARSKLHGGKLDKTLTKMCEDQREQISTLSAANLRLSRIISKLSHLLPKHVIDKVRAEVDSLTNIDADGV